MIDLEWPNISKPKMFFEPRRVSAYNFYINVESESKLELIMSQNLDCCVHFSENAASLPYVSWPTFTYVTTFTM